jgi:hypothetical protein
MSTHRRDFLRRSLLSCGLLSMGPAAAWTRGLPAVPANLYFNSQRGTSGASAGGITYELRGPFGGV